MHSALKVSQLQYSLSRSESQAKPALLYDVLLAADLVRFLGVEVHGGADAASVLHPSIPRRGHQNNLTWFAFRTERLPVAVFSLKPCA